MWEKEVAEPTSRSELIETVKRRLGHPIMEINVTEEQFDDLVDQALRYYYDYHFNGSEKTYYKYQITAEDKTNGYITLPENIIGVVKLFPMHSLYSTGDIFNIQYQILLNDLYTLTSQSIVPYYSAFQHLELLSEVLVGMVPIRYNRHKDRLYIDANMNRYAVGNYLLVEAYEVVDPDTWIEVWRDRWLIDYLEQLVKRQWGTNLKFYDDVPLIGGARINAQNMYDEADRAIAEMQRDMILNYSMPVEDFVG